MDIDADFQKKLRLQQEFIEKSEGIVGKLADKLQKAKTTLKAAKKTMKNLQLEYDNYLHVSQCPTIAEKAMKEVVPDINLTPQKIFQLIHTTDPEFMFRAYKRCKFDYIIMLVFIHSYTKR